MSLSYMLILFAITLSFLLCFHISFLIFKKKNQNQEKLLNYIPFIFMGLFSVVTCLSSFFIQKSVSLPLVVFLSLGVVVTLLKYVFKKGQSFFYVFFSILGLLIMPQKEMSFESGALFVLPGALTSYLLLKMALTFDRIPLFSLFSFVGYFLGGAFLTSRALNIAPDELYFLSIGVLFGVPTIAYILKYMMTFSLREDIVTFLCFFMGYIVMSLFAQGRAFVIPVFFGYEIFELGLSFCLTIIMFKCFNELKVPFLIERVLLTGLMPTKALQKVFFLILVLVLLACLSTGIHELKYIIAIYGCAVILLFNAYLGFLKWGLPQPKLRQIFSDAKEGMGVIKDHFLNKKEHSQQSSMNQNEQSNDKIVELPQKRQPQKRAKSSPKKTNKPSKKITPIKGTKK